MSEQNYFQDKEGKALRIGFRISTPSGAETVLGLQHKGLDCSPVVRIGEDSWQRCDDVEVLTSPVAPQPEAPPAGDEGAGGTIRVVTPGASGRMEALEERMVALYERMDAREERIEELKDRTKALEGPRRYEEIWFEMFSARVEALEAGEPKSMDEMTRTLLAEQKGRLFHPPEPDIIRPMSHSEGEQGETAYVGPEDYDPSQDRCRECHKRWDVLHKLRGSCPALLKSKSSEPHVQDGAKAVGVGLEALRGVARDVRVGLAAADRQWDKDRDETLRKYSGPPQDQPAPSRCICVPKLEGRGTGHSRACPDYTSLQMRRPQFPSVPRGTP